MSNVSSYMFVTYEQEIIKKINNKLSEILDIEITLEEAELHEGGNKYCQFGNIYSFAGNYFDDGEFQKWVFEQKFDRDVIQIFFNGEEDETMEELRDLNQRSKE